MRYLYCFFTKIYCFTLYVVFEEVEINYLSSILLCVISKVVCLSQITMTKLTGLELIDVGLCQHYQ